MLKSSLSGKPSFSQVQAAYKKLKAIKYPARPISNANYTQKKLNSFSPIIQTKLKKTIDNYLNAYRQVRGDGNCFFRALAFSFIANKRTSRFSSIFMHIDDIKLDICIEKTIPKEFKPFYNHQLLKAVLKEYWQKDFEFFIRQTHMNYKRALSRLLNQNHYLDFIIILYFRSLCWLAFTEKGKDFKEFLKGTQEEEITSYGQESQGVILGVCSKHLNINIQIYEVRKDEVITYNYQSKYKENQIYLLFYDNHYDIFEENLNPSEEYEDQKMDEEFYSQVNNNFITGTCIECNKDTDISEETGLCLDCFNKSMQNFNTFQKDQIITDVCGQCQKKKSNISMQLMICQDCLNQLQYSSNVREQQQYSSKVRQPQKEYSSLMKLKCKKCNQTKKAQSFSNGNEVCQECIEKSIMKSGIKKQAQKSKQVSQSSVSLNFSSLQHRLQSKVSKEKKQQESKIQNVMSAKIFTRSKPIQFQCKKCHDKVKVDEEQQKEKNGYLCSACRSETKVKTSGFRQEQISITCKRCSKSYPLENKASSLFQHQVCQQCLSKSSAYKVKCMQCYRLFQPSNTSEIRCTACSRKYIK